MTITRYNSNNSLTPEFKWASFEKRNNLDELINIPTKAEERSMIQISFKPQDLNIKTGTTRNPRQNSQLIHDLLCFKLKNPRIRSIYRKNPQSVDFLRPNLSIRKPIHFPLFRSFVGGEGWSRSRKALRDAVSSFLILQTFKRERRGVVSLYYFMTSW